MDTEKYAIGADIGGTNLRVALVNFEGKIIEKLKVPSSGGIVEKLLSSFDRLYSDNVVGIGIGVTGVIDRKEGIVMRSPNFPSSEGINFIDLIKERFPISVYVENDATVAALGEIWAGAGREFSTIVMLTLGTGIGGGVVYKDKLLDIAAELGHITVEANGIRCQCGNYGCLESYASSRAIVGEIYGAIEAGTETLMAECCKGIFYKITPEDVYRYALEGDYLARETLKKAGKYLGIGIASLINIFSPDAVILAGGLVGAWEIFVKQAISESSKRAFPELYEKTKILPSILKDDAGIIGAAYLAFNKLDRKNSFEL